MKVLLISDNHGYVCKDVLKFAKEADEVWHAGDWLNLDLLHALEQIPKPVRSVWGNADGHEIRAIFPLHNLFHIQGLTVFMTHIGGYPGKWNPKIKPLLEKYKPKLMICGHSHILKVQKDLKIGCLHINPGACGKHGFHLIRTAIRFEIIDGKIENLAAIEFGKRASFENE